MVDINTKTNAHQKTKAITGSLDNVIALCEYSFFIQENAASDAPCFQGRITIELYAGVG
ncbi:hypothetical protein [Mariprofundus ferrooxydans]|jgi:hypothetical protein|uniref:hypothetical protein n=1 Tax=Mariprofundus ferrooxydans TaxID=314344 RepID=UPI0018C8C1A4|nr:hypothetical protein [Mariprofundus ferrooxydans]